MLPKTKTPTIAFVYDRINTRHGGAENLLSLLLQAYPQSPVFTSVYHPRASWIAKERVKTSFLQYFGLNTHHQWLTPLMPLSFESHNLSAYDIIISLSSAEAKGVLTMPHQLHISYIFSPPKYLYEYQDKYAPAKREWLFWLLQPFINLIVHYLRWWDRQAIYRADKLVTLSRISANKIDSIYGLPSQIIYPPLDNFWLTPPKTNESLTSALKQTFPSYMISASRLVQYKKVDFAIKLALRRKQPLLIVGEGVSKKQLSNISSSNTLIRSNSQTIIETLCQASKEKKMIVFLGEVNNNELATLIINAHVGLAMGDEDYGLTPLEILICGTPVIISKQAGVAELISDQVGVGLFDPQFPLTVDTILDQLPHRARLSADLINQLKPERFVQSFSNLIAREWRKHQMV